jgi:hypothetical protein
LPCPWGECCLPAPWRLTAQVYQLLVTQVQDARLLRALAATARQMGVTARLQLSSGGVEYCSSSPRLSSQVPAHISGRLAVLDAELGQHGRNVVIDRLGRDKQGAGDLGVGLSFADQLEHLAFTRSEP